MKTCLILFALLSWSAFACQTSDIQKYFTQQITRQGVEDLCRNHGGSVTTITASAPSGILINDPTTAIGRYVVQCVNGDLLAGEIWLDARTCLSKTALTEPTERIFP